ncbi:MAG: adenylate/guanylate cyclase domain-containing protein [Acidimicrobiales bacterium]|nr:adenylate/guanylate cyclase domain-containing protein [Acidimicrobiales bacterium]
MLNEPVRGVVPEASFSSLTGVEQMRTYLRGRLPRTPHAHLLGYRMTQASAGASVVSQPISPWFEIYDGFVDLTATAELSVFVTAMTVAPPGTILRPVTMSLRYLRPCTVQDKSVIARGRVLHAGSTFTTVETTIEDTLGRGVAHATGCVVGVAIVPAPPALAQALDEAADEPVYGTPDPPRRSVPASLSRTTVPPFATFLGLQVVEESASRAVTTMPASEWFCNAAREVEAGVIACHSTLTASLITARIAEPHQRAVTFEQASSFLRPVPADGRQIVSTATTHVRTADSFVLDAEAVDADGQQIMVGRGTLLLRDRKPPNARRPVERVLLTVLFTDVVGSTETATEMGDARWREVLEEHHQLVRRQIDGHGGREVKTTGDGFLATFDSPSRAVECATAIRHAIRALGLEIRAGLHTGECEVVGRDVAGIAVHVASRVQTAAQPGQILVSGTVRDLVTGSGLRLVDQGTRQLKGLGGDWLLLSVED